MEDNLNAVDSAMGSVASNAAVGDVLQAKGTYLVECLDADGNLKWSEKIENVVVTVGKNAILDNALAGSSYTAAMYVGLMSSVSYGAGPVAADTMASHAGWTEAGGANAPTYSASTRPAPTWAAASSGSKAFSTPVSFSMSGAGTIKGCFLTTNSTKDGTTGTLISAGLFSTGDKTVSSSDTVNVSYSLSI
jgi:hypothetical protein